MLSVNDIVAAIQIIDVCAERGAFKSTEFTVVGALRKKFTKFVDEYNKENQANTEEITEQTEE